MVLLRDASSGGANFPQKRDFFRDLRLEISGGLAIISELLSLRFKRERFAWGFMYLAKLPLSPSS